MMAAQMVALKADSKADHWVAKWVALWAVPMVEQMAAWTVGCWVAQKVG